VGTVLCLHGFPRHRRHPSTRSSTPSPTRASSPRRPTLRGYRPSPLAGPFDLDTLADDALDLAAALSPDGPVHLVGHDWGAAIAVVAAQRHPRRVARLVTLAVPHPLAFLRALPRAPDRRTRARTWPSFSSPRCPSAPCATPTSWALCGAAGRPHGPRRPSSSTPPVSRCARACPAPSGPTAPCCGPLRASLGRIARGDAPVRAPTLHVYGDRDGCMDAATHRGNGRHFQGEYDSLCVPGAGHWPHREAPDRVVPRVHEWLAAGGG
jgi:pimeloyl-ACP methyl ester carboxylesterase